MTFAEKAELSRHYIEKFSEYASRGVLGGDLRRPHEHTYGIANPFRPDLDNWQPSSTAPMAVARMAEEVSRALKNGIVVENLGEVRFHFQQVAALLPVATLYVDKDPVFKKDVTEGIAAATPAVTQALADIDRQFASCPA